MMKGYDVEAAKAYILANLDRKAFRSIANELPAMIGDFITYDLHFMKVTGVVDEHGEQGDEEYDDDEAFEYIYDAWLSDHPENDDEEMIIASLLNEYMDLQYQFLCDNGLTDL